jgi:hypothetical protein
MTEVDNVRELISQMVKQIVDTPDVVSVTTIKSDNRTTYRVTVAHSQVGQVIGRQGRMERSMRTILEAISMKLNRRIFLDIVGSQEQF